jgi:hypothetical protein
MAENWVGGTLASRAGRRGKSAGDEEIGEEIKNKK